MDFYNDEKKVDEYIAMSKGYDGKFLVDILRKYLPNDSTLLELGMGPGKDLNLLNQYYQVTGSDISKVFLEKYNNEFNLELLQLDAINLKTNKKFDGIYSNKVLIHLTKDEIEESFKNQYKLLNDGGIAIHSFWYGNKTEDYDGLKFVYYNENIIKSLVYEKFEILEIGKYKEEEKEDSMYLVVKK